MKGCRIQPSLTLVDVCRQKSHNNPADASVWAHKSQLKMANHRNTLRWATPSLTGSIKPTDTCTLAQANTKEEEEEEDICTVIQF